MRQKFFVVVVWLSISSLALGSAPRALSQSSTQPEVFGSGVLSAGRVYRGTFARDGRTFYFFKKLSERGEDYRIFVSRQVKGAWTEPQPLRLGGEYSDLYPALSPDGKRLVFCSYRPAPGDTSGKPNSYLWYVDRQGEGWGEPVFMAAANTFGNYHSWVEFGPDGAVYYRSTLPDWRTNQFLITR